jgi:hypothetical protein
MADQNPQQRGDRPAHKAVVSQAKPLLFPCDRHLQLVAAGDQRSKATAGQVGHGSGASPSARPISASVATSTRLVLANLPRARAKVAGLTRVDPEIGNVRRRQRVG